MFEDDFLIRQLNQFAAAVAQQMSGKASGGDIQEQAIRDVGLDPGLASQLPPDSVVALLTNTEGVAAERALILALALSHRALAAKDDGRTADAQRCARVARRLFGVSLAQRPDLNEVAIQQVRERLAAGQLKSE